MYLFYKTRCIGFLFALKYKVDNYPLYQNLFRRIEDLVTRSDAKESTFRFRDTFTTYKHLFGLLQAPEGTPPTKPSAKDARWPLHLSVIGYVIHIVFSELELCFGVQMSEFERIKRTCVKRGELWEDPDFPASQASVFYHQTPPFQFVWKRPKVGRSFVYVKLCM